MEKVSNQQTPVWERSGSDRGHNSSVDKAIQAHRSRVDARQLRTQNRLAASREISNSFFVTPENRAPLAVPSDTMAFDPQVIDDAFVASQPQAPQIEDEAAEALLPMGMDDLYQELSATPVRSYASKIVEGESVEERLDNQSDEMPKGSFIDYTV